MDPRARHLPLTTRAARHRSTMLAFAACLTAMLAAPGHPAQASKPPRADLTVVKGDLSTAKGKLVARFTVKNAGTGRAPASRAGIDTRVRGKVVVLATVRVAGLRVGRSGSVSVTVAIPKALRRGAHEISVCADEPHAVAERTQTNNCLDLGTYSGGKVTASVKPVAAGRPADVPVAKTGPTATPSPGPGTAPSPANGSTVPTAPVARRTGTVYKLGDSWVYVPTTYDSSNQVPIRLLIWMHGCGGFSEGDLWSASTGADQPYLAMAPSGADGGCWDVNASPASVLAQLAALETHFNIDRRRIVLGGYSSGGDMAYRMGLDHPTAFAGLLIENSSPFRDSGATAAQAASASAKFPIVHLAHLQDTTYPIATVKAETDQLIAAGFPLTRIEVDGGHYDDAGATENGHRVPGTDADVATYLLPHMADDWRSPAG